MKRQTPEQAYAIFMYNVAWLRKHHGLTKREMANIMHIGTESLNKLENGLLPPRMSIEVFFFIQDHFGISPYEQLAWPLGEEKTTDIP